MSTTSVGLHPDYSSQYYQQLLQQAQQASQNLQNHTVYGQLQTCLPNQGTWCFMADGKKPLVVCNGEVVEAKDMDDAQRIAEEKAHQKSANAYILKPVKQIAPKRDVVTTDL